MEPMVVTELRSINYVDEAMHIDIKDPESLVMALDNNNSFTALLELPPSQAVELLHSGESRGGASTHAFTQNSASIERAAKCSVFANEDSNLSAGLVVNVKAEPVDSGLNPNSLDPKPLKRKERENNGKSSRKKSKATANSSCNDGEKLPFVHVRARRGQATNSHSLAERVRREKINARMKLLQELVPGCNKISGTALVLDEIINHVQSLQRQVEYLSMRLSAVNPRINLNLDSLVSAETEPMMECNMSSTSMPLVWPEIHVKGDTQQFHQQWHFNSSWCQAENSLLSYSSSPNSGLQSSQLKMEL